MIKTEPRHSIKIVELISGTKKPAICGCEASNAGLSADLGTETLFSGDILYDGSLIDNLAHSNAEQYRDSLLRLKELPVRTVHAGHYGSFDGDKMRQVIDEYLAGGRRVGDPEEWVKAEIAKG